MKVRIIEPGPMGMMVVEVELFKKYGRSGSRGWGNRA